MKLTEQENKVVNYLCSKNGGKVYWEELAQFAKDPQNVKRKTIQKTVSEIKRKFVQDNVPVPFQVEFALMISDQEEPETSSVLQMVANPPPATTQKMVPYRRPVAAIATQPAIVATPINGNTTPNHTSVHPAHADFVLDRNTRRVRTRNGQYNLNDSEWQVFEYIHSNVGRLIPISELRDKVVYPQWGSKLPARWFDAIMRIINNLRRQVSGLDRRLLTVKNVETSYLFQ
jgi:hypothetical protein